MAGRGAKIKGNGYEREIVKKATDVGLRASRSWGSDGRSRGLPKDVDIVLENYNVQCKRIKQLPKWLGLTDAVSIVLVREDKGQSYAIMRVDRTDGLFNLLKRSKLKETAVIERGDENYEEISDLLAAIRRERGEG